MMELSAALVFIVLRLRNNLEDDFPVQLAVESLGFCLSGKLLPLPTLLKQLTKEGFSTGGLFLQVD